MSQHTYKLYYFDARGRGEAARLLFAAAGQKYEDIRFTYETWPAEKPNTPFGQLPVLEVDGKKYAQSHAIANFLAREFGFYGSSNLCGLKIDQVVQLASDFWQTAVKYFYIEKDPAKKEELLKTLREVDVPKYLGFFEKLLAESKTGLFVGNSITLADISVFALLQDFIFRKVLTLDDYPHLQALVKTVENHDKIKAYLATRKETEN